MWTLISRNTLIWWASWLLALIAYHTTEYFACFLLPFLILLLNDFAKIAFHWDIFDSATTTRYAYNLGHTAQSTGKIDSGFDYGFNIYKTEDGVVNLEKSPQQGQLDKFKECAKLLGIEEKTKILDVGCGYGDWLNYLKKEYQMKTTGINICDEQVKTANSRQLNVYLANWMSFENNPKFEEMKGTFDYVTFFDSIEHFVPAKYRFNKEKQDEIYRKMFQFANIMLKPKGKVLLSCYHQTRDIDNLTSLVATWCLNNNVEGFYPRGDEALSGLAEKCGFTEVERREKTEDYRLTGALNAATWQRAKGLNMEWEHLLNILLYSFIDPYFIFRILTRNVDYWMMCYGERSYAKEYDSEYRRKVSYVTLWWILLNKETEFTQIEQLIADEKKMK